MAATRAAPVRVSFTAESSRTTAGLHEHVLSFCKSTTVREDIKSDNAYNPESVNLRAWIESRVDDVDMVDDVDGPV
jgi:hypothetical protein